jgi:hypothetical protein
MKTRVILMLVLGMAGNLSLGQHEHHTATATHQNRSHSEPIPDYMKGEPGEIVGFVRDVACLLRNKKATVITDDESRKCVADCARSGSPLAILTKSGELYLPISAEIPDGNARSRIVPYAGKYVRTSGRLFQRGGTHAIEINRIEAVNGW